MQPISFSSGIASLFPRKRIVSCGYQPGRGKTISANLGSKSNARQNWENAVSIVLSPFTATTATVTFSETCQLAAVFTSENFIIVEEPRPARRQAKHRTVVQMEIPEAPKSPITLISARPSAAEPQGKYISIDLEDFQ